MVDYYYYFIQMLLIWRARDIHLKIFYFDQGCAVIKKKKLLTQGLVPVTTLVSHDCQLLAHELTVILQKPKHELMHASRNINTQSMVSFI